MDDKSVRRGEGEMRACMLFTNFQKISSAYSQIRVKRIGMNACCVCASICGTSIIA
jgi:hypothetical protein